MDEELESEEALSADALELEEPKKTIKERAAGSKALAKGKAKAKAKAKAKSKAKSSAKMKAMKARRYLLRSSKGSLGGKRQRPRKANRLKRSRIRRRLERRRRKKASAKAAQIRFAKIFSLVFSEAFVPQLLFRRCLQDKHSLFAVCCYNFLLSRTKIE